MFQLLLCPSMTDGGRVGSGKQPAASRCAFQAATVHPLGHLGQRRRRADRMAEHLVVTLKGVEPRLFIYFQAVQYASTSWPRRTTTDSSSFGALAVWPNRAAGQVHVTGTEAAGLRAFGFLERKIQFVGFFIRLFRFRVGHAVVLSQEER